MFVKSVHTAATLAGAFAAPKDLDITDSTSIRNVASTIAHGTMTLYTGNITNTEDTLAIWPAPVYWWESGAAWGAMLDYYHYTGDATYNDVITQAITSQVGPNYDLMVPKHEGDEGNDDQAFWSFTILEAAERNFPQPDDSLPSWLDIAVNAWNTMIVRWDTQYCGGGLFWQIFASNANGMHYKNSVSNGGLFQLSARLARATGNDTYLEWAQKVWDWSETVGFVKDYYGNGALDVLDGADISDNCEKTNNVSFSYSQGIYLYGAAVLYNYTDGSQTWGDRVNRLLNGTEAYFNPYDNATDIMYEHACEEYDICKTDMLSFKAYMSRFLWATTQMVPSTLPAIQAKLHINAKAAGSACSGGDDGTTCGFKWYVGGYDGNSGLGQQLCALETIQGLLVQEATPPFKAGEIQHVKGDATTVSSPSTAPTVKRTNGAGRFVLSSLALSLSIVILLLDII
ncbi:glycoside hydrolase [Truncatella angustata]|uniref:Mannan endo-1,6-alpha-mannosidase n=1 Tax=Truncatella angustata TaxID=152316 RepID=A0A9P9A2R3_9PEZI|nr:glycoside hydrolase [Truncatella angustata]KAH6659687.1 glycoside hydrolase [Truncatella angustata]